MNALKVLLLVFFALLMSNIAAAQSINPNNYPSADDKEWGQLLWNLKLADQDINDFTNYQSVDEQGVSACRYTIAFSSYFLAAEQYHKFPAWKEAISPAFDKLINRMLQKKVWGYWYSESPGVTKFEPKGDRPYTALKDPVGYRNIMYSGHLGMMINLYQMLYNDTKWDAPGSIVFNWDDNEKFVYDNKSLQEAMFKQLMTNPVPGIECEPNAIFPACNTHPMISWKLYDKMHGTSYFGQAQPKYDKWFETAFIDPDTKELGGFYLIKQGWVFSQKNPKYGNTMDPVMAKMVEQGIDFSSAGNDGWTGTFTHSWNPKLIEDLYPFLKKKHLTILPDGTAKLTNDVITPDVYYGFFTAFAAELGDEETKNILLKTLDDKFKPVWIDGTFHYPFDDKVGAINLAADDTHKDTTKEAPKKETTALCCKTIKLKDQGDANNMKTFAQHSDLSDRMLALARALPKNGMFNMVNNPFDEKHLMQPAISGVDVKKVILKRAIYDAEKKTLIVSTTGKNLGGSSSIKIIILDPSKTYELFVNKDTKEIFSGKTEFTVPIETSESNDIILQEIIK